MKRNDHFNALIRLFKAAPINQRIFPSSVLKVTDGECSYELSTHSDYFHGGEALHGSVYFKMLDDAAYFAAASQEFEYFLVTKSYEISFIRPVYAERITAKGKIIEKKGSGFLVVSELFNETGKVVGKGQGEFVRSKLKLESVEDYATKEK